MVSVKKFIAAMLSFSAVTFLTIGLAGCSQPAAKKPATPATEPAKDAKGEPAKDAKGEPAKGEPAKTPDAPKK